MAVCAEDVPSDKDRYFVRELELGDRTLRIYQEYLSDVGGVVWDSAIVASYYFLREKDHWKNKQVLELGCGTGVCSIVLAVLGANVVATDLPERLPLLRLNIGANEKLLGENGGSIKFEALNWDQTNFSSSCFDVIILVDLFYYLKGGSKAEKRWKQLNEVDHDAVCAQDLHFILAKSSTSARISSDQMSEFLSKEGVESLIRTIRRLRASEVLCIYEERDTGEAYLAQRRFLELAPLYFHLSAVPQNELDPVFSDPSISVIRLTNKEVSNFKIICTFEPTVL